MDCSPLGSSLHEILQARILEWVAMSSSRGSFPTRVSCIAGRFFTIWAAREAIWGREEVNTQQIYIGRPGSPLEISLNSVALSCIILIRAQSLQSCLTVTLWAVAHKAPLFMGLSRQGYWSGLPCPPLEDLPHPGIEPTSPVFPALQANSLPLSHWGSLIIFNIFLGNLTDHWCELNVESPAFLGLTFVT